MAKFSFKVIYVESEQAVIDSQAPEMRNAGYQVQGAAGRKAAMAALQGDAVEMVVLGATLSKNDRHHLAYMAKKFQPTTKVVALHTDGERHPAVDGNTDTGEDVNHVLAKMASTMGAAPAPAVKAKAAGAGK